MQAAYHRIRTGTPENYHRHPRRSSPICLLFTTPIEDINHKGITNYTSMPQIMVYVNECNGLQPS
jgi:hypothetical protein